MWHKIPKPHFCLFVVVLGCLNYLMAVPRQQWTYLGRNWWPCNAGPIMDINRPLIDVHYKPERSERHHRHLRWWLVHSSQKAKCGWNSHFGWFTVHKRHSMVERVTLVGSQFTKGKVWLKHSFWWTGSILIVAIWFTLDLVVNVSSSSVFFI
jgi:hypothetical protein